MGLPSVYLLNNKYAIIILIANNLFDLPAKLTKWKWAGLPHTTYVFNLSQEIVKHQLLKE